MSRFAPTHTRRLWPLLGTGALQLGCAGLLGEDEDTGEVQAAPISVELRDVQLFHPYSKNRYLRTIGSDDKVLSASKAASYGVGLLAVATNDSEALLSPKDLRGRLRFHLIDGRVVGCDFEAAKSASKLLYFSGTPADGAAGEGWTPTGAWTDERSYPEESAWRPGEQIRLVARQDCGPAYLTDVGVQQISIEATVTANVAADGPLRSSSTATVVLPPDAMTLRRIRLNDGSEAHLSGDIVVYNTDKGPKRTGLSKLLKAVHTVELPGPLPATMSALEGSIEGLSYRIERVQLQSWEEAQLSKGDRLLRVFLELEQTQATEPSVVEFRAQHQTFLERAASVEALPAEDPSRPQAERELVRLEREHAVALSREQRRIRNALICNKLQLVTNKGTVSPEDSREVRDTCSLATVAAHQISLTYALSRYELPVALSWTVDGTSLYHPVASTPLLEMDPR